MPYKSITPEPEEEEVPEWPTFMSMLDKLRCPETGQKLMIANAPALGAINRAVDEGVATNVSGQPITERLTDGLIREDQLRVYPVKNGVPILLIEEGIGIKPTG